MPMGCIESCRKPETASSQLQGGMPSDQFQKWQPATMTQIVTLLRVATSKGFDPSEGRSVQKPFGYQDT